MNSSNYYIVIIGVGTLKISKNKLLSIFLVFCILLKFNFTNEIKDDSDFSDDLQINASMSQKWAFDTGNFIESTPAAADLNADGYLEIVFGSNDNKIYCINHLGAHLWNYTTSGDVVSSASIADIDSDGYLEILIGSNDNYLYCLNSTGSLIWSFNTGGDVLSSPAIADLNNDGLLEIIVGTANSLNCLFSNGTVFWSSSEIYVYTSPVIADMNNDGYQDVVIVDHMSVRIIGNDNSWDSHFEMSESISPVIADVDQDGLKDILVIGDSYNGGGLYCLELSGDDFSISDIKWFYPINYDYSHPSPVVGVLDNDGTYEIIVCKYQNEILTCLDHLGVVEWEEGLLDVMELYYSSPALADIDNNGYLDIIVPFESSIWCYNNNGGYITAFHTVNLWLSSPIVVDIDLDGFSEILIGLGDDLVCIGLSGVTSYGSSQWSTLYGSIFHTGHADRDSDYLDDLTEEFYGTDKNNNDTDIDLLLDMEELFTYQTDPLNNDTDSDLLLDGVESFEYYTNPLNNDTDADNLNDWDEIFKYSSNPLSNDSDSDDLLDWDEINIYGTNLTNSDTDLDGLQDGEEILTYSTDPLLYDTDFDGYSDSLEISEGTDPLDPFDYPEHTTITLPPVTVTPPPITAIPPPTTITHNNTITITVETGIIITTTAITAAIILSTIVILSRKRRK
ncbi:MAG: PQQ-binding-like beta-propeller repeat protein [Asgard group archaeon]|nr:PQQ-binding-like beta-propeller repeat protein [Asgard group archaeon]